MGVIKDDLKASLSQIFGDLNPNKTAEQKADELATAIENAILNGLQVKIPSTKVLVGATAPVFNPAPIDCQLDS